MAYGVLPTGFVLKPLDVIKAEIEADQRANISPALNQQSTSVIGQLNAIMSDKLAELWEVAQGVYASQYPDSADGVSLDRVASITGAQRLPATKSTVTATCTGTPGTVLPAGRVVSVDPSGARFVTIAEATIGGGGTVDVEFEAEETGAVLANAGTLTEIETPVSGWTSVTNAEDADVGREIETDEELRQRRIDLLEASGDATVAAIRAEVLDVDDVEEVYVFKNDTDATDADGVPPHSVEVVVRGGADADIREALLRSVAAGIGTHGDVSGTVTDDQGIAHTIEFSRPTEIALEMQVDVNRDVAEGFDDVTTVAAIKSSLAAYVNTFVIGQDAVRSKFFDPAYRDHTQTTKPAFTGIVDIEEIYIGTGGVVGTTNLTATLREVFTLDTADITIVLS